MRTVEVVTEPARGCGYRKPSKSGVGIYMMGGELSAPCGLLPFPLERCPTCDCGIKPSRSWTWIKPAILLGPSQDCAAGGAYSRCRHCVVRNPPEGRHGLLWIGGQHYKTPLDFVAEARKLGVSRKLNAIPNGFELSKHWVYLAHREAVPERSNIVHLDGRELPRKPGIFSVFKPTRIDLVIEDETKVPELAERIADKIAKASGEQAVRIVKVVRAGEQQDLEQYIKSRVSP